MSAIHWADVRWPWREVPEELQALPQWVLWKRELVNGRWTKVPYTVDGRKAKSNDRRTWATFERVCQAADEIGRWDGIGFVFVRGQGYCGVDLDHIWQSDADEGANWALGFFEVFGDTYGEESPSTTGYKIICRAKLPATGKSYPIGAGKIEIFDQGRFFAITGISNGVPVITDHQEDILALLEDLERIKRGSQPQPTPPPAPQRPSASGHDPRIDLVYQHHYYAESLERHPGLASTAAWWWTCGLEIEEIRPRLIAFDQSNCHPPKQDRKELEGILDWVAGRPR
jgi:hypothetical protein